MFEIEILRRYIIAIDDGFDRRRDGCEIDGFIGRLGRCGEDL
jgi:hypothetical protein